MTAPTSILFLGHDGELAQRIVLAGVARGWRVHTLASPDDVLAALGQVMFDVILYERGQAGALREARARDPDLARVPAVAILPGGKSERSSDSPTLGIEAECGLVELLAFLVRSRDPAGPTELAELMGTLEVGGTSGVVQIREVRVNEIEVVAAPARPLPRPGAALRVQLPWLETPTLRTCLAADGATRRIRIGRELRLV